MRVRNQHTAPVEIPAAGKGAPCIIAPGAASDVPDAQMEALGTHPVVKGWIEAGMLVVEGDGSGAKGKRGGRKHSDADEGDGAPKE